MCTFSCMSKLHRIGKPSLVRHMECSKFHEMVAPFRLSPIPRDAHAQQTMVHHQTFLQLSNTKAIVSQEQFISIENFMLIFIISIYLERLVEEYLFRQLEPEMNEIEEIE